MALVVCPVCDHVEEDDDHTYLGDTGYVVCRSCDEVSSEDEWRAADPDDLRFGDGVLAAAEGEGEGSDDEADDAEESAEERDFRLARANLEQAQGLLEAAETTGERERIRDAINREAFEEIEGFIREDGERRAEEMRRREW